MVRFGRNDGGKVMRRLIRIAALGITTALPGALTGVAARAATNTVTVLPLTETVSTAEPLVILVAVNGGSGGTAQGSVVLTVGAFRSVPVPLLFGYAAIIAPPGVLPVGADALTVSYVAGANGSGVTTGSGSAPITVTDAALPAVSAQTVATLPINGHPVTARPFEDGLLVSVSADPSLTGSRTGVDVFRGAGPTAFSAQCTQVLADGVTQADGLAVTPDGQALLVAAEVPGLDILPAVPARAGCNATNALVYQGPTANGENTFDVAPTPDSRFAFVANEYGSFVGENPGTVIGNVGVVALGRNADGAVTGGTLVGQFASGGSTIPGVTLSPDGRRLYVTSELRADVVPSGANNPQLARTDCVNGSNGASTRYGLLTVVDVAKAEADPSDPGAILVQEAAGCSPVRSVESADGEVLWVAARGENEVLAFSTQMLESNPDDALLGEANTGGVAPVGLQLFDGGRLLAVANSNRFSTPLAPGNLTILRATAVSPAVVATAATSLFPRNLTKAADDRTLYLTDYDGGEVQVIKASPTQH